MMDYNTPHGKLNRGMAVLDVLKAIKEVLYGRPALEYPSCIAPERYSTHLDVQDPSEEEVFKANALGWCIEFVSPTPSTLPSSTSRRVPLMPSLRLNPTVMPP